VENSSDAGEPSGSAGVPILNSLKRSGIINIGFAVVRYFGGTRLGKGRLMDIYGKVTEKVIKSAGLKPWIDWCQYRITGPLGSYGDISIGINKLGGKIILDNSNDQLSFQARIPRNKINNLIILIRNATQGQGELILEE
jgi:putative IMPACT (imprinted ancient) family translation regulator